jgi:hypothetical protein
MAGVLRVKDLDGSWVDATGAGAPGPEGPAGPPGADSTVPGPAGPAGADGADGAAGPGVLPGGTTSQVLTKASNTDYDTVWQTPIVGGGGVTDGDKGDIVVSDSGATWLFDTNIVTAAAKTLLDDTTTGAMKTTLGLSNVDNTSDAAKPVSSATQTQLNLMLPKATTVTGTAPITAVGPVEALTIAISDFTASTKGAVPNPVSASGRFLKDDGTWDSPASVISGAGGVFPFMLSSTATEPPTGSQVRGNNATFTSSTKLWIMEVTVDGLDVSVGLGRIKAGFQIYIQDYDASAVYAVFNATSDAIDKGTYWEVNVALASSAGTIPAGKIALQSLSSAQAGNLFSTTTSAKGLAPGSSGGGASVWLNGSAGWTAPTATTVGLGNVSNTSDATKDAATATLTNKTLTDPKINLAINAQSAAYTLVLTDNNKVVIVSNASAVQLSVPTNASVAFPIGAQITVIQGGAGQVTVAAVTPGTTTVNATPGAKLRAQSSGVTLVKTATDVWYALGDLSA